MATLWKFLIDFQGTLKFNNPWYRPLDKENDCNLMTQVLKHVIDIMSPHLTLPELKEFNLCWLYLQVLTLSNITTSPGRGIDITFWKEIRSSCTSNLKWPRQIRPSQQMLDHIEKTPTPTIHQITQIKPAKSATLSLPLAFPLAVTPAMVHIHWLFHTPAILKTPREPQHLLYTYPKTWVQSHIQWHINTLAPYQQCSHRSL